MGCIGCFEIDCVMFEEVYVIEVGGEEVYLFQVFYQLGVVFFVLQVVGILFVEVRFGFFEDFGVCFLIGWEVGQVGVVEVGKGVDKICVCNEDSIIGMVVYIYGQDVVLIGYVDVMQIVILV